MTLDEAYKIIPEGSRISTIKELMYYISRFPEDTNIKSCCSFSGNDCSIYISTTHGEDGSEDEFKYFFDCIVLGP